MLPLELSYSTSLRTEAANSGLTATVAVATVATVDLAPQQ